jgi:hypothetical protein
MKFWGVLDIIGGVRGDSVRNKRLERCTERLEASEAMD